jgi:Ca-activated chloride channel family protein
MGRNLLTKRIDRGFLVAGAITLGLGAAAIGILYLATPREPKSLSIDAVTAQERFAKFIVRPPEAQNEQIPEWLKSAGSGRRQHGEEGKMGKRGLYSLKGPSDSRDPHLAKILVEEQAKNAGVLGVLANGGSSIGSTFNRESALGSDGGYAARIRVPTDESNSESYHHTRENPFLDTSRHPLSTFSIDVDTASYSNVRRFLDSGQLPPPDAVRVEEMINYFPYDYPQPDGAAPFSVNVDVAKAPWEPSHRLVRIGLKGREIDAGQRPPSNLVFLIDVSGSMEEPNRLPLVQRSLRMLVERLDARDRIAMVVYAGSSGLVLPPTSGRDRNQILDAIERLSAGGSTNGGAGIELAYRVAQEQFISGGSNRVILATDGDFNVGVTDQGELTRLIEAKAKAKVYLTVLGFGMGNLKDATLEQLADKGHGNYAYIDSINEARKVLIEQMTGTLNTIARDVKIQLEIDPKTVKFYRQIGYENRAMRDEEFDDDKKSAGDIGAGHTVTALYELVPATASDGNLMTVKLRYKSPEGDRSELISRSVRSDGSARAPTGDFQFAAAVAAFGMKLRGSHHGDQLGWDRIRQEAEAGRGVDRNGYRAELIRLVKEAQALSTTHASR